MQRLSGAHPAYLVKRKSGRSSSGFNSGAPQFIWTKSRATRTSRATRKVGRAGALIILRAVSEWQNLLMSAFHPKPTLAECRLSTHCKQCAGQQRLLTGTRNQTMVQRAIRNLWRTGLSQTMPRPCGRLSAAWRQVTVEDVRNGFPLAADLPPDDHILAGVGLRCAAGRNSKPIRPTIERHVTRR